MWWGRLKKAVSKDLIYDIDPRAFVFITDAHEVLGEGFKDYGEKIPGKEARLMAEPQEELIRDLEAKAKTIRKDIIRMLAEAGSGHPGGSLSSVEIVTALYFHVLRLKPEEPLWQDRDRFILSKGHAAPLIVCRSGRAWLFPCG